MNTDTNVGLKERQFLFLKPKTVSFLFSTFILQSWHRYTETYWQSDIDSYGTYNNF